MWMDGEDSTLSKMKVAEAKPQDNTLNNQLEDSVKTTAAQTEKAIQTETALKKVRKANVANNENQNEKAKAAAIESKVSQDEVLKSIIVDPNSKFQLTSKDDENSKDAQKKAFRDFRYGATFFWDYEPTVPTIKDAVNLEAKTPERFYPIINRKFEKKEAKHSF